MNIPTFNEAVKRPEKTQHKISESIQNVDNTLSDSMTKNIYNDNSIIDDIIDNKITENVYELYRDKHENFICEVSIEGASLHDTKARLIIESPEWNLFFNGTVENDGRCVIPIKKLFILPEGMSGIIKLEIIAEDLVFVPWEQEFIIQNSKKVSVKILNQKSFSKPKVNVNF